MKRVIWINLIVGVWLIIAPLVLRYDAATAAGTAATASDVILGILLVASSWWILAAKTGLLGSSWLQVLCGVWLIIAPFVLGSPELVMMVNSIAAGVVVLVVSALETWTLMPGHVRPA